jgi:hypothetical protein
VSAVTAIEYAMVHLNEPPAPGPYVISVLTLFAVLALLGTTDSANVAVVIFTFHCLTLAAVLVCATHQVLYRGGLFLVPNFYSPSQPPCLPAIVFGFASAMLGVSGFESSSNFVEEQVRARLERKR